MVLKHDQKLIQVPENQSRAGEATLLEKRDAALRSVNDMKVCRYTRGEGGVRGLDRVLGEKIREIVLEDKATGGIRPQSHVRS